MKDALKALHKFRWFSKVVDLPKMVEFTDKIVEISSGSNNVSSIVYPGRLQILNYETLSTSMK